jgi:hypothetical protein
MTTRKVPLNLGTAGLVHPGRLAPAVRKSSGMRVHAEGQASELFLGPPSRAPLPRHAEFLDQ